MLGRLVVSALVAVLVFALTAVVASVVFSGGLPEAGESGGLGFVFAFSGGVAAGLITSAVAFLVTMVWLARRRPPPPG